jgi:hypothetical protein
MTVGRRVRRRRRARVGALLAAIALTPLVRVASADPSMAHGRSARHLGRAHASQALPPTRPGTAPSGAAGPPPLGAAGPPPLGAAGPPPLGAAGPPPLGAAGPPFDAAPRTMMGGAPRPGLGSRCEGEGCVDAVVPSRADEGLPFDAADEQPMDASPRD